MPFKRTAFFLPEGAADMLYLAGMPGGQHYITCLSDGTCTLWDATGPLTMANSRTEPGVQLATYKADGVPQIINYHTSGTNERAVMMGVALEPEYVIDLCLLNST